MEATYSHVVPFDHAVGLNFANVSMTLIDISDARGQRKYGLNEPSWWMDNNP